MVFLTITQSKGNDYSNISNNNESGKFPKANIISFNMGWFFSFMRIAANMMGPAVLIEARVFFAAIALLVISVYLKRNLSLLNIPNTSLLLGCLIPHYPSCCLLMRHKHSMRRPCRYSTLRRRFGGRLLAYFGRKRHCLSAVQSVY